MKRKTWLLLLALTAASHASASGRIRYLCGEDQGTPYFSATFNKQCRMKVLDDGWSNFSLAPNVIVDTMPSGTVREKDGVKIWTQFSLVEPVASEDGQWSYDGMRGVSKFYCRKRQIRLMQATYYLGGSKVYERLSPESIVEEIEPGTLNEELYLSVCRR